MIGVPPDRLAESLWRELRRHPGDAEHPVWVVASSGRLSRGLRRECARQRIPLTAVHFSTLDDLARRYVIPSREGAFNPEGNPWRRAPGLSRDLVLWKLLREQIDQLRREPFGAAWSAAVFHEWGFLQSVAATVDDLMMSGIGYDNRTGAERQAEFVLERWLASRFPGVEHDEYSRGRRALVAELTLRAMDQFRRLNWNGRASVLAALAEEIAGWRAAPCGRVIFAGFYDATGLQTRVFHSLASRVPAVWLVPHPGDHATEALSRFSARCRARRETEEAAAAPGPENDLQRLRAGLFQHQPLPGASHGDGGVIWRCPANEAGQAHEIVRTILRFAGEGVALDAMAVTARRSSDLAPICRALDEAGVPHNGPAPPLAQCAGGRAILLALDCLLRIHPDHAPAERGREDHPFLEWLSLGVFPGEADAESREFSAGLLENELAQFQPTGESLPEWLDAIRRRLDFAGNNPGNAVADAITRSLSFARKMAERLLAAAGVLENPGSEIALATLLGAARRVISSMAPAGPAAQTALAALEALAPAAEYIRLRMGDALELITETIAQAPQPRPPAGPGALQVADVMRLRGLEFEVICLAGLNDGVFPRAGRGDPLLNDPERGALQAACDDSLGAGEAIIPLKESVLAEERLLFHGLAFQARRSLVLFVPQSGGPGELPPSPFALQALEAVLGGPRSSADLLEAGQARDCAPFSPWRRLDAPAEPLVTADEHWISIARQAWAHGGAAGFPSAHALAAARGRWLQSRRDDRLGEFDGAVSSRDMVRASLAAITEWSASQLEQYAECPYRFFLGRVLRIPRGVKWEEGLTIDPRQRGELLHKALELAVREELDLNRPRGCGNPDDYKARGVEYLNDLLERYRATGGARIPRLRWELEAGHLRDEISTALQLMWDEKEQGEYDRMAVEFEFGSHAPGEPVVEIRCGEMAIRVLGRIDRIDARRDNGALRIVDYKSGKLPDLKDEHPFLKKLAKDGSNGLDGASLQLFLYAEAARILLKREIHSVMYQSVARRGKFDRKEALFMPGHRERLLYIISTWLELMSSGLFPRQSLSCRHCDWKEICGGEFRRDAARKIRGPDAARFNAIWSGADIPREEKP
ncbi:MAG: ATP-dependent helicase/deoxyribonuclease subunit B [Myxococcota bacterium]|nr:ATP-dependent helicase/deoxyribonuclease subunit B [Myxococcota bacterium]